MGLLNLVRCRHLSSAERARAQTRCLQRSPGFSIRVGQPATSPCSAPVRPHSGSQRRSARAQLGKPNPTKVLLRRVCPTPFNIGREQGAENLAAQAQAGPLDYHRRGHSIMPQGGDECDFLPGSSGTVAITLTPRGAHPRSRLKFVLTAVSSINTSRARSKKPCSCIQRRRARATSARCRSAACGFFM